MKLTLIDQQEKASQCIKNLSVIFEHAGAKIDITTGNTMLHDAIIYRKLYLVKDLLKLKGLDINFSNKENFTAFALAAYDGQSDVIATLIKAPNIIINIGNGKYSQTALQFAIIKGHREIAEKSLNPANVILINKAARVQPLFISQPKRGILESSDFCWKERTLMSIVSMKMVIRR
ncbi:ankyrin repeat domain-containing protein [Sodalis ligni]|nr:ankyrin repeat domain-containing protein [Sodalis ligni]QWA11020.1 ankyrin repeat domain-containing protein [Sodalis ligni]